MALVGRDLRARDFHGAGSASRRPAGTPVAPSIFTKLLVLLVDEVVSHSSNVVAHNAGQRLLARLLLIVARQSQGFLHPVGEQGAYDDLRIILSSASDGLK